MAIYRTLQADFTGGELDPMMEANINLNLRTIGVKQSINTLHLNTGPVIKRPPSVLMAETSRLDIQAKVELSLKQGTVNLFFTPTAAYAYFKDDLYPAPGIGEGMDHSSSMFAVYLNTVIETDGVHDPMEYVITVHENDNISIRPRSITRSVLKGWKWKSKPRACAFAGGRLFFGFDSTVVASRTPQDAENRFYDFTLADHTYKWQLSYSQDDLQGWKYKETYELQNKTGFTKTIEKKDLQKRTRIFSRREIHLDREDVSTPPEGVSWLGDKFTLHFTYAEWEAFGTDDIKAIIDKLYETEAPAWEKNFTEAEGEEVVNPDKEKAREHSIPAIVEYTLTDNYLDGELVLTDATIKTTYEEADGTKTVEIIGTDNFPDLDPGTVTYVHDEDKDEDIPDVQVSHAIEINETDLMSSEILWIANMGRIIVGTKNAVFISTEDVVTPQTFDLKPTLYDGSAPIQPSILNSLLIYVSANTKKLYGAIYNNEIQGLQSTELTMYARHLFLDGIRQVEISDSPYYTLFVLTNSNQLRVGSMVGQSSGFYFAFSTWQVSDDTVDGMMVDRGMSSKLIVALANSVDTSKTQVHAITYREPYEYGLHGVELMMDHQQAVQMTPAGTRSSSATVTDSFLPDGTMVDAILTKADGTKDVVRGLTIAGRKLDVAGDYTEAVIGLPVQMTLQLFQQYIPNNAGVALQSRHSVAEVGVQIYKSVGGEVWYNGEKVKSLLQLQWLADDYGRNFIDPHTGQPYSFTGVYTVTSPTQQTLKDELAIISTEPYPFNIMGVALKYNVTETS